MTTKTEIINLALGILSANLISSPDDDSDEAKLSRLHYDTARDSILELQEWQFAIKRFIPAKDADQPLFGWEFQYTVPTDILRVLSCDRIGDIPANMIDPTVLTEFDQIDWILEDDKILANVDVVHARGVRRVTETGKYSANFVYALSTRLAVLMALPLTQSNTIFDKAAGLHAVFLSDATSRDQIQGRSRRIRNKSLLRVR